MIGVAARCLWLIIFVIKFIAMVRCVYTVLVHSFGERRVQAWAQERSGDGEVERKYRELCHFCRQTYESQGIDWRNAPVRS